MGDQGGSPSCCRRRNHHCLRKGHCCHRNQTCCRVLPWSRRPSRVPRSQPQRLLQPPYPVLMNTHCHPLVLGQCSLTIVLSSLPARCQLASLVSSSNSLRSSAALSSLLTRFARQQLQLAANSLRSSAARLSRVDP